MNKRRFLYLPPIILLLIITVSGWFVMDFLGNKARQEIIQEGQTSILTLSTHIFSTLNSYEGAAKSLAGSPWISPALLSGKAQDIEHANSVLDRYNTALNTSVSYLMDADGITVASSNRNDPDSFVGKSYRFRPYFQEAAKGHAGRYFALGITSGKRGFYASYLVWNPAGKVVGVVAMKMDIDGFETFFQKYAFCFFVSPEGIIFLSSTPEMVLENLWPLDKAVLEKLAALRQFGDKLEASGGEQGLKIAGEERPDIIFLDLMMPGMDGFETLSRLKASADTRDIPVIIVTSKVLDEAERRSLTERSLAVISKEATSREAAIGEIRDAVQKLTAKKK